MNENGSLHGLRIQLSGADPESDAESSARIQAFTYELARLIADEGGMLIHGSHPSLVASLERAMEPYTKLRHAQRYLTLARSRKFVGEEFRDEIVAQRAFARVEILPRNEGASDDSESLVPMREWMAQRCDVVIAIGGRHEQTLAHAGVAAELDYYLEQGKPCFVVNSAGGAIAKLLEKRPELYASLRNGLDAASNKSLASRRDMSELASEILAQIARLPLARNEIAGTRMFRILALDGGGLRGAFTAAVLAQWAEQLDKGGDKLAKHFDLIAGTSTGSILAVGLAMSIAPKELCAFYAKEGPKIFPKGGGLRHYFDTKYEIQKLIDALRGAFEVQGEVPLAHVANRLVIPTIAAHEGQAVIVHTPHRAQRGLFDETDVVTAAAISSAAPTYFASPSVGNEFSSHRFCDGGLWANNPVLAAIAEAAGPLQVPLSRLDVLSIGTLDSPADFSELLDEGKLSWMTKTAEFFFAAQESGAAQLADALLSPARHMRVNRTIAGSIQLDDTSAIPDFLRWGSEVGAKSFEEVQQRFFDGVYARPWKRGASDA